MSFMFSSFFPSSNISPLSGFKIPKTHLIKTDFPLPDPPIMQKDSPASTSKLISSSITFLPNDLQSPETESLLIFISQIKEQLVHNS